MLLMKVIGKRITKPMLITRVRGAQDQAEGGPHPGEREGEDEHQGDGGDDPQQAAARVEAHDQPEPDHEAGGEQVAACVTDEAADDRRPCSRWPGPAPGSPRRVASRAAVSKERLARMYTHSALGPGCPPRQRGRRRTLSSSSLNPR
jgi:hypothetical protein